MMMMSSGKSSSNSTRYPFTPSQWQELEHQALIFKYMSAGIPIPSDLLIPIKRSFIPPPPSLLPFSPHQPTMGWSCFQMGYGRKAEDPEPGRCRRTDGKKWRCSKEAYPDSKYCERHMHRGKNRSRKPVEISLTSTTPSTTTTISSSSSSNHPPPLTISTPDQSYYPYHLLYPHPFSTPHNNTTPHFHLDSEYSRYGHGMKDVDEYSFFTERGRERDGSSWQLRPLGLGSNIGYSKEQEEEEKEKRHCFVLGADFKLEKPVKEKRDQVEESQGPLRHFFDEWPQKSKEAWMGLEGENSTSSNTHLSISIPLGLHDYPQW